MSQDLEVDLEKGKVEVVENDEDSVKSPERKQLMASFLIRSTDNKPEKTGKETRKPECEWRKEKRKKSSPSKPPRPPRGPSLDAADQKLIREITELAMLKRARQKTLKKTRASKNVPNLGNVLATLFTIVLCFIIFLAQGISKRHLEALRDMIIP